MMVNLQLDRGKHMLEVFCRLQVHSASNEVEEKHRTSLVLNTMRSSMYVTGKLVRLSIVQRHRQHSNCDFHTQSPPDPRPLVRVTD